MFILINENTYLHTDNIVGMIRNTTDGTKWDLHLNGEASITPITVDGVIRELILKAAGQFVQ